MLSPTSSLDELRAAYPHLGFAVYALEPGGTVTLEVHTPDGQLFTWSAPTVDAAIARAFPPETLEPEPAPPDIFD
ncbi:hypothetical protein [Aminobacter sp. BE322]|uniref:hypothetical protein n=1 Tax=unclassified Aminobacter TaxID=2644704 RepID=UPI003D1FD540